MITDVFFLIQHNPKLIKMVQTMFYFLGLLCSAAVGVAAGLTLDEALIKDILPPPSKSCLGAKAEGDFSFTFKHTALPRGHWHDMNVSVGCIR